MSVTLRAAIRFLLDETGLEMSEYALGAGLMAIAIATAFGELGVQVSQKITELLGNVEDGN